MEFVYAMNIPIAFFFVMFIVCLFMCWVVFSVAGIMAQLGWHDLFIILGGVPPLLRRYFAKAWLMKVNF